MADRQCDEIECYVRWQDWNMERDMQLERAIAAESALEGAKKLLTINKRAYRERCAELEREQAENAQLRALLAEVGKRPGPLPLRLIDRVRSAASSVIPKEDVS